MQQETLDIYNRLTTARLPSLPQVLLELLALCDRDDAGMAEIGAVVSTDAGVAARIVGIANSPFYNPKRSLQNIDQCLAVLGTGTVRRLALNQAVAELFGRFQGGGDFDLRYFWYHGLCVAVTARHLARQLGYANDDEAYLAGLLHDVGQLALLTTVPDRYLPMLRDCVGEQVLMIQEQAVFGLTHAEVGAWLAKRWNLHSLFADSILYHHESLERIRDAHPLAQIVTLANQLNSLSETALAGLAPVLAHWKLDVALIGELLAGVRTEARDIAAELGLEPPPAESRQVAVEAASIGQSVPGESGASALAEAVSQRMQGLLAQPQAGETTGFDAALRDVLRGASQVFGACGCAVLMPQDEMLVWRHLAEDASRDLDLRVACASADSRIAAAFRGRIGLAGVPARPDNLADTQLLRLLDGERLLCLPLMFAARSLGVLAVALDQATVDAFASRQTLLITFAREAGKCLGLALRQDQQLDATLLDADQARLQHARNLIHEAGNPLSVVRNYMSVLRSQADQQDKTQTEFALIEDELRRVGRILQRFKEPVDGVAPGAREKSAALDINHLTRNVVDFCRLGKAELRDIDIVVNLAPDLPKLRKPGDSVKQILTNLLFNAAEALHGKGRISIASALWVAGRDRRYIELSVADNGPGLPPDVLASLYQPVRTGKGGEHAGLGLSIVAGLVEELGGMLQCNSSAAGAQFKILLPLDTQDA
jgi:putative nucleotidyltransferase with HDIG domain